MKIKKLISALVASALSITMFSNLVPVFAEEVPPPPIPETITIENDGSEIQTRSAIGTVAALLSFVLLNYPTIYQTVVNFINSYGTKLTFGQIYDAVMQFIETGEWPY